MDFKETRGSWVQISTQALSFRSLDACENPAEPVFLFITPRAAGFIALFFHIVFMKVLFDTNILLAPARSRIDLFGQLEELLDESLEYCVLSPCLNELQSLRKSKGREGAEARVALLLLKANNVKTIQATGKPDDALVLWCSQNIASKPIVCTDDKELRERLKRAGARVVCMKHNSKLEFG